MSEPSGGDRTVPDESAAAEVDVEKLDKADWTTAKAAIDRALAAAGS